MAMAALGVLGVCAGAIAAERGVEVVRVPHGGIQPEARMDANGTAHLIYFKGDPLHGDIFYVYSKDGAAFSEPIRVNSQPGSAIAAGTVRGPHLTLGKNGRVHVAWMGSNLAKPKAEGDRAPMLYTRMNNAGDGFEPQRNVIQRYPGVDGGGSVAADSDGNVYVAWHAPREEQTEADRYVWVTRSRDGGRTFEPEVAANPVPTGACGCCGMRIYAGESGKVYVLYRSATDLVHRDIYLLISDDHAESFTTNKLSPWKIGACVMSTASLAQGPDRILAAWETEKQVYLGRIDPASGALTEKIAMPGEGENRKHPRVAVNSRGESLVAWTEGTGWNQGGSVAWQMFGRDGRPLPGRSGKADGLPAWGTPAVIVCPDDSFKIMF